MHARPETNNNAGAVSIIVGKIILDPRSRRKLRVLFRKNPILLGEWGWEKVYFGLLSLLGLIKFCSRNQISGKEEGEGG